MKKDKNWLRKTILKNVREEYFGESVETDKVFELIDQLDEPEITEEQAWKIIAKSTNRPVMFWENMRDGYLSSLKEPELPVIPQFVDKWVRSFDSEGGSKWDLLGVVTNMTSANVSKVDADIFNWLNDGNRKLFMDAITNGYKVEKEPEWTVKLDKGRFVDNFIKSTTGIEVELSHRLDCTAPIRFKDKSKAEAVALLVNGEVVEVTND